MPEPDAYDRDEFAALDRQANAAERAHLEVAKLIGFVEIGNAYDDVCHECRARGQDRFKSEVPQSHLRLREMRPLASGYHSIFVDYDLIARFQTAT